MARAAVAAALTLLLLAPLALLPGPADASPPAAPAPSGGAAPLGVLALVDDGINPYHHAFRDASPRALQHPSTYVPGYPADAVALPITLDGETDLVKALKRDCRVWEQVRPGQLYWFPGTRIVGAIHFSAAFGPLDCEDFFFRINATGNLVGAGGHGTMTASRAGGNGYGACPECLLVMVQNAGAREVRWAASQPWIDAQSNSWGPVLPVPGVVQTPILTYLTAWPDLARAIEESAARQPSFWASGNGALFRFGVLGHPTQLAPHLGPSAIRVGGHDNGRVALWPGSGPHVVSDACASWAAAHARNDRSAADEGGGTSAATPYAAGLAVRVVREARAILGDGGVGIHEGVLARGPAGLVPTGPLADGVLTTAELKEVLFRTADARPDRTDDDGTPCSLLGTHNTYPVEWSAVPDGPAAVQLVGYGALTKPTAAHAAAVLRGEAPLPARTVEDLWFEADRHARGGFHLAYGSIP